MAGEFDDIARLLRPLTGGAPGALDLLDDAAFVPSRPGYDLVITKDAMVEGVHFLPDTPADLVARKLLRVNLSDLAAKAAEPYGYFLSLHWPPQAGEAEREAFARGLAQDQAEFDLTLLGGDTVSTTGPFTVTATLLGWVPEGRILRRSTARPGNVVLVTGTIGDGALGLEVARAGFEGDPLLDHLADRYRLPRPRTTLRDALLEHASAAADVSDGLMADAGHIGDASGVAVQIDLERLPLSPAARAWIDGQADPVMALAQLATGGDDYEIVCTADMLGATRLALAAAEVEIELTPVGRVAAGEGTIALHKGRPVLLRETGWRHS